MLSAGKISKKLLFVTRKSMTSVSTSARREEVFQVEKSAGRTLDGCILVSFSSSLNDEKSVIFLCVCVFCVRVLCAVFCSGGFVVGFLF